ncbi:MAG: ChaN family lipoprotein [Bacteroidetes bacterium]|nr:ChaN family lipoprotein [Bacteroidota bacterium]MBS1632084.1 ChaN family lipoprotein [Bacteroidota bacterium]
MKYISFITVLLFSLNCFSQPPMENNYKIYNTKTKQLTTIDQIVSDCADADVLFFGEEHNDSTGHFLEAAIFKALYQRFGNKLALSMEMFETDCQLPLDEYLKGFVTEKKMITDARAWSNYKDYRPAVEFAKENHIPVIAANTPRRYVSLVSKSGMKALDSLSKEAKKYLPPLPYDTLSGRYYERFAEIMKGSPGSTNPNVYYSQNLWDAGMSYSIYKFWKKNKDKKIFHLCGRFHSDEKLGTLAQLQKRKSKLKILNISSFSDESFDISDPAIFNWEKFSNLGDYVIVTNPRLKRTF